MKPLQKKVSDYLRDNFYITNSRRRLGAGDQASRRQCWAWTTCSTRWTIPTNATPEEVVALDAMEMDARDQEEVLPDQRGSCFNL